MNKFDGLDIDKMFKEAVDASEDTNETIPENDKKKVKPSEVKSTKASKPVEKVEPKVEPKVEHEKKENKSSAASKTTNNNINVDTIGKIIEMKNTLDSYTKTELQFIKGYFKDETGNYPVIIHKALIASERELDALNKIVKAKDNTSAERAFYLMELTNNNLEAMIEQIELLTGGLEDIGRINNDNKISVCRTLEMTISDMDNNIFNFISKLQDFTSKAIN